MYLSNRDMRWAIDRGMLIVDPPPEYFGSGFDETSIDLHLDTVENAKIWDVDAFARAQAVSGGKPELHLGSFNWAELSEKYLIPPPAESPTWGGPTRLPPGTSGHR